MKIRNGFVSNSSSSSFIIAKAYLSDEQWNGIINWLEDFRSNPPAELRAEFGLDPEDDFEDSGWGESGRTFSVYNNKYLIVEDYYIAQYFSDALKKFNISREFAYEDYR